MKSLKLVLYFATLHGDLKAKKVKKRDVGKVLRSQYHDTCLVFFKKRYSRGFWLGEYVEVVNDYDSLKDALCEYSVGWIEADEEVAQ